MKNPSYVQCLKHLAVGRPVWIEDERNDQPEIFEDVDDFVEQFDNAEDYDEEKKIVQFVLK